MKNSIDKSLLSLYKNLLISKLKEYDAWQRYEFGRNSKGKNVMNYVCYPINNNKGVKFTIHTNVIELTINDASI